MMLATHSVFYPIKFFNKYSFQYILVLLQEKD